MSRILLIDDDLAVCDSTATILTIHGYAVMSACDGAEGLRLAARFPFDVVLTDVMMPDIDGIEVIQQLRALHPDLKIIAMLSTAA